jgi:type IV secretory pathway TrbF-like protein
LLKEIWDTFVGSLRELTVVAGCMALGGLLCLLLVLVLFAALVLLNILF